MAIAILGPVLAVTALGYWVTTQRVVGTWISSLSLVPGLAWTTFLVVVTLAVGVSVPSLTIAALCRGIAAAWVVGVCISLSRVPAVAWTAVNGSVTNAVRILLPNLIGTAICSSVAAQWVVGTTCSLT